MNQYNLNTEEITRVISLYSKIASPEKRIYAQGYLNGLSALPLITPTKNGGECKHERNENA